VLQDLLVLAALGTASIWFPSELVTFQAKVAGLIGWPPAGWITKSDTILTLLQSIGVIALGFCLPLALSLYNRDTTFAGYLGVWHIVNALLLGYCISVGGTPHKALVPFAAHNAIGGLGLLLTVPGKWQSVLNKVHAA